MLFGYRGRPAFDRAPLDLFGPSAHSAHQMVVVLADGIAAEAVGRREQIEIAARELAGAIGRVALWEAPLAIPKSKRILYRSRVKKLVRASLLV